MRDDEGAQLISLNFHRKWALAIVVVTAGVYGLTRMVGPGMAPFGIVAFAASAIAFLSLFVGAGVALFTRPEHASEHMCTVERFLPAVVLILSLGVLNMLFKQDSRDAALAFATEHRSELAGPAPQSVIYTEGIPDGGSAIVASPDRNPMTYAARVRFELTNGNMTSCEPLDGQLWVCQFG